ncbi:S41 family peptidase [Pseudidiomarina donghaiensis]|uniref:S41 family peptidase n=1 Tax=Pseudidiomarina donghaiensis TaxID=519452 RepID=UPI003A96C684
MRIHSWFIMVAAGLLSSCSFQSNTPVLHVSDGVYWSHRYQSYLVVDDAVVSRYQFTPSSCWLAPAGLMPSVFSTEANAGQHEWMGAGFQTLVFKRLSDGVPVVFTREPLLPKLCERTSEVSAETAVNTLADTLHQFHHGISHTALLKWRYQASVLDSQNQSSLASSLGLFELLSELLEDSNDEHAYLLSRELERYYRVNDFDVGEAQRELSRRDLLRQLTASDLYSGCEQSLWWGMLSNGEYYLGVLRLHRFTPEASYSENGQRCLQQALRSMAEDLQRVAQVKGAAPKLIIDLRYNEGGSLLLASQLAQSLVPKDEPLAIISGHSVNEQRRPDLSRLHQRGKVLVTEVTASAAEHLAHGLRLRGFVLQGQHTRGAFAPTTVRTLPNGWIVGMSMYPPHEVLDGLGNPLPETKGLTPDDTLPIDVLFPRGGGKRE